MRKTGKCSPQQPSLRYLGSRRAVRYVDAKALQKAGHWDIKFNRALHARARAGKLDLRFFLTPLGAAFGFQEAPLPACAHPHGPNRSVAAVLRTEIQRLSTMPTRKPTPSAMPSEEKGFCLTASSTALSASPAVSCTRSS